MKKTINISIGQMAFIAEEDAYLELESYLNRIKTHFKGFADSVEIVTDIEARMADQFLVKAGPEKIINLEMVNEIISIMGSPSQFGENNEQSGSGEKYQNEPKAFGKKFMRNGDDVVIAGVASGIGAYFGIDPIWIRLGFVLLALSSGFGILLYILLWVILPEAKTDTEKMQMRGEPINLKNVEAVVKERVEEFKKKDTSKIKNFVAAFAGKLAFVVKKLVWVIVKILALALTLASIILLGVLLFSTATLIFNPDSRYIDFPLSQIATGSAYYAAIISGFFVAFVPVMFLVLLGTSLLGSKSSFTKLGSISLAILWVVAVAIFANMVIKLGPNIESAYANSQNYQEEIKPIDVKGFSKIKVSSNYEVIVEKSTDYKITASGRSKDLEEIHVYLQDETLVIEKNNNFRFCLFCLNKPVKFQIYTPNIVDVSASSASKITLNDFIINDFMLKLSGASKGVLNIHTQKLNASLSGASKAEIIGNINLVIAKISGASNLNAREAKVINAEVDLSGASKAYFGDLEFIKAKASGASKVNYYSAKIVEEDTSGSSKVEVFSESIDSVFPMVPKTPVY